MAWTNEAPESLFASKNSDPQDPRLREWFHRSSVQSLDTFLSPSTSSNKTTPPLTWSLLGYPDDEGIGMNGGRIGAKEAPDMIRSVLYKMTPFLLNPSPRSFLDLGNLSTDVSLPERHQRGRQVIHKTLSHGLKTLSFGGGHDYGYADGAGFLDHCRDRKERALLINFDAHLDVRPSDRGFHSGTPFHRLLTDYPGEFDFVEVGLQNHCNSAEHLKWAKAHGAQIFLLEDIRAVGLLPLLQPMISSFAGRPVFLSVDIDAFAASEAPGCSQSWQGGLTIQEFIPVLKAIEKSMKVSGVGIYEVSPPLDFDRMTSKLAALIAHFALFNF